MNIKSFIEEIPFSKKKEIVKGYCLFYKKISYSKEKFDYRNYGAKMNLSNKSIFEELIELLTKDEQLIFKKEFLNESNDQLWYLDHWCKTTYYKIKHSAIDNFLFLVYS